MWQVRLMDFLRFVIIFGLIPFAIGTMIGECAKAQDRRGVPDVYDIIQDDRLTNYTHSDFEKEATLREKVGRLETRADNHQWFLYGILAAIGGLCYALLRKKLHLPMIIIFVALSGSIVILYPTNTQDACADGLCVGEPCKIPDDPLCGS